MRRTLKILSLCVILGSPLSAFAQEIESVTLEGGPIASHHFQSGDNNFRQSHSLGIVKVHTQDYGNWGLFVLAPNSVDNTSIGAGYVTDPYSIPLGPVHLELSGGVGLVTGYQDYPVPLLEAEARLVLFQQNGWDAGLSMAAIPYFMKDENDGGSNHFGIVATSPFLSVRYSFN